MRTNIPIAVNLNVLILTGCAAETLVVIKIIHSIVQKFFDFILRDSRGSRRAKRILLSFRVAKYRVLSVVFFD